MQIEPLMRQIDEHAWQVSTISSIIGFFTLTCLGTRQQARAYFLKQVAKIEERYKT